MLTTRFAISHQPGHAEHLTQRRRLGFLPRQANAQVVALAPDIGDLILELLDAVDLLLPVLFGRRIVALPLDERVFVDGRCRPLVAVRIFGRPPGAPLGRRLAQG